MAKFLFHPNNLGKQEMSNIPYQDVEITLESALEIMEALSSWLIKSGIGYTDFAAALKPIFYNEAIKELNDLNQKPTDSSISLLSGLNRRDVSNFRQEPDTIRPKNHTLSVPARVVTLWVQQGLPPHLPFSGEDKSFEKLVKDISSDKHPRSIFLELQRLGLVSEISNTVILHTESFTPSNQSQQIKRLFAKNISDHLSAGISNITKNQNAFLEQSIHANELTEKSIQELRDLSIILWKELSKKVLDKAIECCKIDEGRHDAHLRFSLGIYQFEDIDK